MHREARRLIILVIMLVSWLPAVVWAIDGNPGDVIKSVDELKELKDKGLLCQGFFLDLSELVSNGYPIEIVETTDRTKMISPTYLEVSKQNIGKVILDADNNLVNFNGGRPFPDVSPSDPQCGVKTAWNYHYRHMSDSFTQEWEYLLTDTKGNIKRLWGRVGHLLTNYRTDVDPKPLLDPKDADVYKKMLIIFDGPFESKGLAQLSWYFTDSSKDNAVWTYVPGLRRTTRTGAGAGCDALGGFVSVMDDDYGFAGNVTDFEWKFIDVVEMLVPTIVPPPPHVVEIPKGLHSPVVKFEKRSLWLVENISKDPNYCYSKRDIYFDPETFLIKNSEIYDKSGNLWKNYWVAWAKVPNPPSVGGYSLLNRAGACTDYKIGEGGPYHEIEYNGNINKPAENPPKNYTLDYMRRLGR